MRNINNNTIVRHRFTLCRVTYTIYTHIGETAKTEIVMAADNPRKPYLERLPPEVLGLILGQFCQHCRGERTGSAPEVYFDRIAALDDEQDEKAVARTGSFPGRLTCTHCHDHLDGFPAYTWARCSASHYPVRTLATHWREKEDLRSLCLVSRALCAAAQPVLYHLYRPYHRADDDAYARLFRFVGALTDRTRRDDLATSVRSLCVGHPCPTERWNLWHYALSSTSAALRLRGFLAMFPPGSRDEAPATSSSPGLFSNAEFIGGLLRLLPSLTELSLGNEVLERFEDYAPACLEQVGYPPLRTLEVSTNAGGLKIYFDLKKLSKLEGRIIELSRDLRMLKLHLCDSLGLERKGGGEGGPKFSLPHLRSLRMTESCLDAEKLNHLLSACPAGGALRKFVYDAAEVYLQAFHNCTGDVYRTPPEQ